MPTAAAAVCARRRAAETREAMMSRSGCKESKVATGACAAPTQQHQHTPSGDGRRARWSPPRAEEMGNGVEKGAISQQRRGGGDGDTVCYADTGVAPFNREIFSICRDEFDVFTPSHQSERVDLLWPRPRPRPEPAPNLTMNKFRLGFFSF